MRSASLLLSIVIAACSPSAPTSGAGRIVVVFTIDWEGAELSTEGFEAIATLRRSLPDVPFTHFVSAAYMPKPAQGALQAIRSAIRPGDELAVHLHAWRSLARAAGTEPRVSPSFLTGTDELVEFEDGDLGFDTDLDTYDVPALRALLHTSRRLLEETHLRVSRSFRAGGYLGTPKVLLAAADEGIVVDSSALDHRSFGSDEDILSRRIAELWPNVDRTTQPFFVRPHLLEIPIAAIADDAPVPEIVTVFEQAHTRLQRTPDRDVFVVLAFHLETASDYADRLQQVLAIVRQRPGLGRELAYATIEQAAELAQLDLTSH